MYSVDKASENRIPLTIFNIVKDRILSRECKSLNFIFNVNSHSIRNCHYIAFLGLYIWTSVKIFSRNWGKYSGTYVLLVQRRFELLVSTTLSKKTKETTKALYEKGTYDSDKISPSAYRLVELRM